MKKLYNILKNGKLLMILLAALFVLSACSEDNTHALSTTDAVTAADEARSNCWQQDVLKQIYEVIGSTVMKMYDQLSAGALNLMMISFAVWVGIRLIKFVSSVTEDSPAEIWNEILRKAFICLFCGYLASSSGMLLYVVNTLIFPIYSAFLEFGGQILALSSTEAASVKAFGEEIIFNQPNVVCQIEGVPEATLSGFPSNIQDAMGCMICAVADRMQMGRYIAYDAMTSGALLSFIIGFLVWAIFLIVGFGFVFYLVDSIFRFGMMILLLPIFIMAYAFGPTRKWTNIGFTNIMNSAAFMMAFSIIIATALMAIVSLITDNQEIFNPSNPKAYVRDMNVAIMCLLLIGFLVFGSLNVSQQLTSAIIGGKSDAKFQQNLKAFGQALLGIITGGFGWVLKKTMFYEKTALGRSLKSAGGLQNRLKELAGRTTDK